MFLKELNEFAKNEGFMSSILGKNIYFELIGFASKGILTTTHKLKRFEAQNYYRKEIEKMFAEGELAV